MCDATVTPLTKEGAAAESIKSIGIAVASIVLLFGCALLLLTAKMSYSDLGGIAFGFLGWFGLILTLLLPIFPYLAMSMGVLSVFFLIRNVRTLLDAKFAPAVECQCPGCQKVYLFTRSCREFEFVCPDCHSLVHRDKKGVHGTPQESTSAIDGLLAKYSAASKKGDSAAKKMLDQIAAAAAQGNAEAVGMSERLKQL